MQWGGGERKVKYSYKKEENIKVGREDASENKAPGQGAKRKELSERKMYRKVPSHKGSLLSKSEEIFLY